LPQQQLLEEEEEGGWHELGTPWHHHHMNLNSLRPPRFNECWEASRLWGALG